MKRILVVGAGFTGSVVARELAEAGFLIEVIDKRNHIAGNAYDEKIDGTWVHKYGPHFFHTKLESVQRYILNTEKPTNVYKHEVVAEYRNELYTMPPNRGMLEKFSKEEIIDIFYRPYTKKMWGVSLDQLDPSIVNRVKLREDDNLLYFPDDPYQIIPKYGYTDLIAGILDHENIIVNLNTEFDDALVDDFYHIFSSAPIDEFYNFRFGDLGWRSIKFDLIQNDSDWNADYVTKNFTTYTGPTRVTHWHNIGYIETGAKLSTYEYPCDYEDNNRERYYPVKDIDGENKRTYSFYKDYAKEYSPNVTHMGRGGSYAYIDMDQAINQALQISKKFLNKNVQK